MKEPASQNHSNGEAQGAIVVSATATMHPGIKGQTPERVLIGAMGLYYTPIA
jgi:hypothetical protein